MSFIEIKFIQLLSNRLRNFKRKGNSTWNFSCPICCDSEKDKKKARGYIYLHKGDLVFKCHNCGIICGIPQFIRHVDENVYREFRTEQLLDQGKHETDYSKVVFDKVDKLKLFDHRFETLHRISSLDPDHYAREYVASRLIPEERWNDLYYCPEFYSYTNSILRNKFSEGALRFDKPRLLIPFRDEKKNMFAYQGRSFDPKEEIKYITISLEVDAPTIFGLDRLNTSKDIFTFEGPLDACFIDNSIGVAGGDLVSKTERLNKSKLIVIYDNECRSKSTIKKIQKAIDHDYRVCIWPKKIESKDLNQMILDGYKVNTLKQIILDNTFKGNRAQLELNSWSKI